MRSLRNNQLLGVALGAALGAMPITVADDVTIQMWRPQDKQLRKSRKSVSTSTEGVGGTLSLQARSRKVKRLCRNC